MGKYIRNKITGRTYRITIATKKFLISAVKRTPEKMFIVEAYKNNKENKAYICYNTEYRLPENFEHIEGDN